MARSYVKEAREKVGPKRARIRPVIERLATEHADAVPKILCQRFDAREKILASRVFLGERTISKDPQRLVASFRGRSAASTRGTGARVDFEPSGLTNGSSSIASR